MHYALIALLIPAAGLTLAAPIARPQPQPQIEAVVPNKRDLADLFGGDFSDFFGGIKDVVSSFIEDATADSGENNANTPQDTSNVADPTASQGPATDTGATQTDTGAAPATNGTTQDDGSDNQNIIESLGSILSQLLGGGNIGDVLQGTLGNVIGNLIGGIDGEAIRETINDGQ